MHYNSFFVSIFDNFHCIYYNVVHEQLHLIESTNSFFIVRDLKKVEENAENLNCVFL